MLSRREDLRVPIRRRQMGDAPQADMLAKAHVASTNASESLRIELVNRVRVEQTNIVSLGNAFVETPAALDVGCQVASRTVVGRNGTCGVVDTQEFFRRQDISNATAMPQLSCSKIVGAPAFLFAEAELVPGFFLFLRDLEGVSLERVQTLLHTKRFATLQQILQAGFF